MSGCTQLTLRIGQQSEVQAQGIAEASLQYERFLARTPWSRWENATIWKGGRLVGRLRDGGTVWPPEGRVVGNAALYIPQQVAA